MSGAPFVHRRTVAFSETDAAGIVHFAQLFRYMEDAEHALIRAIGGSVHVADGDGGFLGFPRVHAEADFHRPLCFEDAVEVEVAVRELRRRSVRYGFTIRRAGEVEPAAVGQTVVVCARRVAGGGMEAVEVPVALRAGLEAHLVAGA